MIMLKSISEATRKNKNKNIERTSADKLRRSDSSYKSKISVKKRIKSEIKFDHSFSKNMFDRSTKREIK